MSHVFDDPDVHSLDARLVDVEEKIERVERVLKSLNQAMDSLLRRCGGPAASVATGIRDATKPYEEAL